MPSLIDKPRLMEKLKNLEVQKLEQKKTDKKENKKINKKTFKKRKYFKKSK